MIKCCLLLAVTSHPWSTDYFPTHHCSSAGHSVQVYGIFIMLSSATLCMITVLPLPICRQVLLALLIGIWLCAFLGNTAYIVFSLVYCQHLNYTSMLTWQKNTTCVYLKKPSNLSSESTSHPVNSE